MKKGPVTRDELMAVWAAAVDSNYRLPLQEAGDGHGLEIYSQAATQLARVSESIDRTTQALYILPHSGQTDEPARGEAKATVTLSVRRLALTEHVLYLAPGSFIVAEETTDYGENGPVTVQPGRKYITTEPLVFCPGEAGPFDVAAEAEYPGWSYNNPLPNTITLPVQPGAGFERDRATVVAPDFATSSTQLPAKGQIRTVNEADTFVPEHVGRYVSFVSGANAGLIARVLAFAAPPDPSTFTGSIVDIDVIHSVDGTTFAGTFQDGEEVTWDAGASSGILLVSRTTSGVKRLAFRFAKGTAIGVGDVVTGTLSGATLTVRVVLAAPMYTSEVAGASWRVLDWQASWGIEITNNASPEGGRLGILDAIGDERDLQRATNEEDDTYRVRVATLADVVSPNALKRALSRALGALPWVFREVGQELLPGCFYDGTLEAASPTPGREDCDAYDTDVYVYEGLQTSGTFQFQEPCTVIDDDGFFAARGYVGRVTAPSPTLQTLTLIRRPGGRPIAGGTYTVRGDASGATFRTLTVTVPPTVSERRMRRIFDYEQFRAFFLVEVPRLSVGEFGMAFDAGLANAYDVGFTDGFAAGMANIYRRAYQALDQARAGGVGFDLEQAEAAFPIVNIASAFLALSFSPQNGPDAGGTLITIIGAGFTNVTTVEFDLASVPFTLVDDNTITFVTTAGFPGFAAPIEVSTATETVTLNGFIFDV